jgi:hypothetical protein
MPVKRKPSEAELAALAEEFRALWRQGDVVVPWLRKHKNRLRALIVDDWSWAAIANALTRAGITYRTGRPWTANNLRYDVRRASRPLKRQLIAGTAAAVPQAAASPIPAQAVAAPILPPSASAVPRFKPGSLKPYEPPRPPTADEEREREAVRKKIYG